MEGYYYSDEGDDKFYGPFATCEEAEEWNRNLARNAPRTIFHIPDDLAPPPVEVFHQQTEREAT